MCREEFSKKMDYLLDLLEQTDNPMQIYDLKNKICSLRKQFMEEFEDDTRKTNHSKIDILRR